MVNNNDFNITEETAWCPGCGNFPLRKALSAALKELELDTEQVAMFTGIGQAAKMPHYIKLNGFNGLHGRSFPPAIGTRVGNHKLKVIVESGDGCSYGEGGNHILHNIRRNPDVTHLVHNNQIYGLTKGQASPTSEEYIETAIQVKGTTAAPFKPAQFAVGMGASFVARSFVGDQDHLKEMIKQAMDHRGYALIDILQPCVSFNKINTYKWYSERVYKLDNNYDPENIEEAFKKAREWGDNIPIGVIYKNEQKIFRDRLVLQDDQPLVEKDFNPQDAKNIMNEFK
jgi:2-oxoglutarate ferredoxin oxidoreductase subunit beta